MTRGRKKTDPERGNFSRKYGSISSTSHVWEEKLRGDIKGQLLYGACGPCLVPDLDTPIVKRQFQTVGAFYLWTGECQGTSIDFTKHKMALGLCKKRTLFPRDAC